MTTFVDGQTVIEAAWLNSVDALLTPGGIAASDVSITTISTIAATDVQGALAEIVAEKQPLDDELTALATSTAAANKIPYFTGTTTAGTLDWNSATALANSATTISSNTVIKAAIDAMDIDTQVAPSTSGNVMTSNGTIWTSKNKTKVYSYTGTGGIASAGASTAVTATTPALDNTIPQNTEGAALLDVTISCAVGDVIEVSVLAPYSISAGTGITGMLFVDSVADAIYAATTVTGTGTWADILMLRTFFTATGTSHTFKCRASTSGASTITFNTTSSAATLGGVVKSVITAQVI